MIRHGDQIGLQGLGGGRIWVLPREHGQEIGCLPEFGVRYDGGLSLGLAPKGGGENRDGGAKIHMVAIQVTVQSQSNAQTLDRR